MKALDSCSQQGWEKVYSHVNKAVVFINTVFAELLHWQGGLGRLINAGATSVKELSSCENAGIEHKKGVFLVGGLIEGEVRELLHDIIQASHFQYVVVITTHSSAVHAFSRSGIVEDDTALFGQIVECLMEWMGNMNYTAEVFYIPVTTINLGHSVFLTPEYTKLFPLVYSDLCQLEYQYNSKHTKSESKEFENLKCLHMSLLPKNLQIFYKSFVSHIDSLLTSLNVKEDIFSLGHTSAIIATELEAYPPAKNRRKTVSDRASILFIDCTLDLAGPGSFNTESLLDRIRQVLPRLPGHTVDVKINMVPVCKVHRNTGSDTIAAGCLASLSGSQTHLQTLITGKQKEALMEINRNIVEAASSCNLPLSLTGRPTKVTTDMLNNTVALFRENYKGISKHLDQLQVAMATAQMLSSPIVHHIDELVSVEKCILQILADAEEPNYLSQVQHMLQKKTEDKWSFSLDDILTILVYVYAVSGNMAIDEHDEKQLKDSLVDRILVEKEHLPSLVKLIVREAIIDRSFVADILDDIFDRLSAVAVCREHLQQFRLVLDSGSIVSPATHNSLLKQLVSAILDPKKADLVDVENKSSSLKDKLKSGFGLFRTVAKPRPNDHPLMILFIIGGVNCTQIKQIQDVVNQLRPSTQVIIGSTRLVTPLDIARSVLYDNNICPIELS